MVRDQAKRVVVIGEDDEPIAALLREAVDGASGYQAVVVLDGAGLVGTVRQARADLLILDIMMPRLRGFEVYDGIRDDPRIGDMPCSWGARRGWGPELDRGGDVISKPFDLSDLTGRVRGLQDGTAAAGA